MEKLSDNIIFNHVLPCLDFFVFCDLLPLRETCKRFKSLVHRYLKSSPCSFQLDYINSQLSVGFNSGVFFESSMNNLLKNINKVTHGQLFDYLSQSNQNKIKKSVLKSFKPLMYFVEYTLPTVIKPKSRTEYKKKRLIPYLEFLGDFWSFKNKLLSADTANITKSKITVLKNGLQKQKPLKAKKLQCLSASLQYISLCCDFNIYPTRDLMRFLIRNKNVSQVSSSTISDRIAYLQKIL